MQAAFVSRSQNEDLWNDRFWRIVLKKSPPEVFWAVRGDRRAGACLLSGRHRVGQRNQLCQLSEVLDGGSEQELVLSTKRTSQPESVEAQDALEMCEQHLDFFRSRREVT